MGRVAELAYYNPIKNEYERVAELAYAYGSEPYLARGGGSTPPSLTIFYGTRGTEPSTENCGDYSPEQSQGIQLLSEH